MRIKDLQKRKVSVGILFALCLAWIGWSKAEAQAPTGAIAGLFSVSDSTQVYFSQGNLQYQASTNTWQFAENQYDYVGDANSNISSTYSGWIDLFGWGTSGYNHGAICYQPWSTSSSSSDYCAYGSYTYNLYDQTGQADWGYNPISNGGNQANQWRTLTQPEWAYIFNTRTTSSGIRYAKATVNGVNGVILLPDDWSRDTYSLSNTNSGGASYSSNVITTSQWSALEQAGAVFLPAAGSRYGASVYGVGSSGYYWSASYSNSNDACRVGFFDSSLGTDGYDYRYSGRSVRLVAPAENYSFGINATPNPVEGGAVSGGGSYAEGATCTLTATPAEGYTFINWTENDEVVSTEAEYSFTVTGDRTLEANFAEEGSVCAIVFDLYDSYGDGYTGNYLVVSYGGFTAHLTVESGSSASHTLLIPNGSHIVLTWIIGSYPEDCSFDIRFETTVSIYHGSNLYNGFLYEFDLSCEDAYAPFSIAATANPTEGGTINGTGIHEGGSTCTLTAMANEGYTFIYWTENEERVMDDATYSFVVNSNRNLVANFTLPFTITATANHAESGMIVGAGTYNYGDTCVLTAIANAGYSFMYWAENGAQISSDSTYSFVVDSDHDLVANFSPFTITAIVNPTGGGDITGMGSYNYGDTCTMTAAANEGYVFMYWTENGEVVSTEAEYSFTVTGDRTLEANFAEEGSVCAIVFDLYDSYGDGYTGNYLVVDYGNGIQDRLTVPSGSYATYTRLVEDGSHVVLTWISGSYPEDCSFALSYSNGDVIYNGTYLNNSFNYEVDVNCAGVPMISFDITTEAIPLEGGAVFGAGEYVYGTTCSLTATANTGYTFINWTENDEVVSTEAEYSFTVMGDRDLVANFGQSVSYRTSLSDDFNDGEIDPELWTYTGNSVLEEDGLLKLQQNVTDQDVHLRSVNLRIPDNGRVYMEREFLVHYSYNYYFASNTIQLNDDENSFLRIEYVYTYYYDDAYQSTPKIGVYLITKLDGAQSELRLCDVSFDTWLTEYVEVDFSTGTLSYQLDGSVATVTVPGLAEQTVDHYNVKYGPYGWWTGHYHYMDYVNINTLTEGLIAYYPFDGDANDYSGNEYHATPYNNYQYEDGIVGDCIAVEGQGYTGSSGGHVMLPELDFGASTGVTLNLWVNALGLSSSDGEAYINFGSDTETDRLYIMHHLDQIRFVYHDAEISIPNEDSYTGNWVMYSLTLDENGTLKAYVNGISVGEESVTFNGINTSLAALGRHWWYDTSTRFIGSFDEVRIYNRALSPEEVQMLYGYNVIEITATATPEEGGTVSGAGLFSHGDTCTLIATPNASYTFINWTENGEEVSAEAEYSFTVTGNRDLVANFMLENPFIPTEDLVAYYPFDGDANDYSGNGNHGTIIGNVVPATDRHGNPNGAYRFPGQAFNYISVPDAEILHLNSFTLSAWVYTDADNYGSGYLINKGRDITNGSYRLNVTGVGAQNEYSGNNGVGIENSPEVNQWHMITGTVEGDQARFYVDGVLQSEGTLSHPFSYGNSEPLTLGCHYYSGVPSNWAYTLLGVMDEVRIYSRVLTHQEVMQLYAIDNGCLPGAFSVAEGSYVNFSKGNLQYQASTDTWRFAENQWDCVGPDNANISETYDGWIDLFGWGTSGYEHGANAYQPWSTSQNNSDYWAYGDSGASLSDQTGQADWGYNAISNGGNQEGQWHTLSHGEWDYLINSRPASTLNGVENARHAKAVVNGIAGLILFPDHYAHPEGIALPVNINAYSSLFTDNEYTMEQWYEMEAAGAVFLPTAGIRNENMPTVGSLGIYWSTTPSGSPYAHRFDFTNDYVVAWGIDSRWYGYSVRLVKNVLTTTCSIEATPNPIEGGTVTGAGTYFVSETCTLTAIPNEGYTFMNWTENGEVVATDATYSFTVTTERNLVANFALPFTITASATPAEGGTVSGAGEYDYGTECTLVATPNEDYNFVNWTKGETVVSTQSSYSFVVTEDADYVAHFVLKLVGTVTAEYDPDPNDNQSPYVRVSWSRDSNMQENFESGDFNMHAWEFPDSYPWVITDYNPYEGGFCMRSNNGGAHNTASSVQTTIFIPWEGQMSFWSRISSESSYDYGRFYIDDQQLGAWSGNGGWEQHIYDITAGQHTFKWAYTKDGSVNSNDDCFYVDNINFFGVTRDGTRAVHHYEVYRSEYPENGSWELIADNVSDTTYVDTDWSALAEGWYQYGVAAYYEGFDTVYPTYMARSNRILRAYPHTITATANPEEGGTITGAGDYVLYTECTLTATANENYTFVNWTENGEVISTESTYSFTVTTERDLVANFALPFTITASATPAEGGTVSGTGEYDYGTECTLVATPNEDYYFSKWTENGTEVSRNATYSFTVTTKRDLVAHFELKPVGLVTAMYDPDPEDNQSPYVRVNWNMEFNLREDFESGDFSQHEWEINGWIVTDYNPYEGTFCMKSDNHGNSTSSYAQVTVYIPDDRQMSFWSRISSESRYDFGRFYIDGQEMSNWSGSSGWEQHTYDITAGEHTFKWAYTKDGSVSSNEDSFYVDNISFVGGARSGDRTVDHYQVYRSEHPENGSWELLADNVTDTTYVDTDWSALAEGWYKYGVVANYAGVDTLYTTPMIRSNRILRAYPHTITATANPEEGGTITGAGEHIYNSECTLIATPNENYTFVNWTENGQVVSTDATYSFTVTTERDLVANFVLPFIISVSAVPEEGGTVTGAGEYIIGTECTLTATANEGYEFMYWTENGAMVSSNTTYSFTVTADHDFVAYFAENTQTISLSPGWTWISTYIEQESIDGLAMLEEGLNPNGVMIKSQSDGFLSYDANMWIGTLDAIVNEKMYLVNITAPSEVTMTGPVAHLADHPITVNPNWTWLGYPSPFEMDVNDALANLNATEGDMLKSQSGFSTYSTEYGWFGSLNTLTPGKGLMYQSHNSQAITLTYAVGMSRSLRANVTAENNHWGPNIHAYPNNMSILAVVELNGEELQEERYELAVFSGDECRGSARLVYVEAMRRYVAFLSVAGDEDAELCLALYDSATGEAYFNTSDCLSFETNAVLGNLHSPFVARFGGNTELDEFGDETVILYPNPVSAGHVFQLELPAESMGARVSIINALGSMVSTTDLYAKPATLRAPDVPGVYTVRIVTGKQRTYCRKLIVK